MSAAEQQPQPASNAEAIDAWDGPLFERFVKYRHIVVAGLQGHGDEAVRLHPPEIGKRTLDIGCGFGDTTRRLAALTGPEGLAVGVDASPRFIDAASAETRAQGIGNVRFRVADVQTANLGERFNLAFSQFGTMFFANPVAALRNVRRSLAPGGKLVMVVWRSKAENEWLYRAQTITERFLARPQEYDAPTCGPGPFSMADADTTSGILTAAGFDHISLRRCDMPISIGANIGDAVEFAMSLGPAGEILRLAGERATHLHGPIAEALHQGFTEWDGPDGVTAPASTWIVSAIPGAVRRPLN
jgi:SAM-dependent methyltransferase